MKRFATQKIGYKNNPPSGSSRGLPGKRTIGLIYLPPTDQVREENMRDLLNQLSPPIIWMGDFNVQNPLWRTKKSCTGGKIRQKIQDKFNLLCLNEKEETYYRAYEGCKSTIDLTFANISIASEMI